jgi:hypothetical protein
LAGGRYKQAGALNKNESGVKPMRKQHVVLTSNDAAREACQEARGSARGYKRTAEGCGSPPGNSEDLENLLLRLAWHLLTLGELEAVSPAGDLSARKRAQPIELRGKNALLTSL